MTGVVPTAAAAVLIFALALRLSGMIDAARGALATAVGAAQALRDPDLDDDARERAARAAGLRLLTLSASLILRAGLTLLAAAAPLALAHAAGLADWRAVAAFLERWEVLLGATVLVGGAQVLAAGRAGGGGDRNGDRGGDGGGA